MTLFVATESEPPNKDSKETKEKGKKIKVDCVKKTNHIENWINKKILHKKCVVIVLSHSN